MQWNRISKLLFILLFYQCTAYGKIISLDNIDMCEQENELSMIFQFDSTVKYHCMLLSDPERLVIDLNNAVLKAKVEGVPNNFLKQLRSSNHDEYLRLVLDLTQAVKFNATFSATQHSLTLHLTKKETTETVELTAPSKIASQTVSCKEDKFKSVIVVIDPGHGGKDPGATGQHGTLEKEIVLKISKKLQTLLNDEPGFCAILTRSTDCYLPLRKRLAIARKNHADMFIAIHADAYNHTHATGASVYALSPRGATSEAARWLAEKENESELGGLSEELADKDALLRSVLIDLSQTHTIEASLQIGNTLLKNLSGFAPLHHPRVEQAAFVVLKSPDIPSVLVETGFLSNPNEEEKLIDSAYQHQTAYAIKEGIKQYFVHNPPGGTWFSHNRQRTHEVALNEQENVVTDKQDAKKVTKR